MFQHFILTRFNLRDPALEKEAGNVSVVSEDWLTSRLELFENYCLPTVKAQSNKHFTWLVFFDVTTPDAFKEKIAAYAADFDNFHPIFINGMDEFLPSITHEVGARLSQPYVITSRLDNDDAWHQDFVQEIQAQFAEQDFLALDVVDGYTMQVEPQVRLGKRSHVHNPFISLIEKSDNFVTVWSRKRHGHWSKVKALKPLRGKRLWMSVIHEENKTNEFLGYDDIPWQTIKKFNLPAQLLTKLESNMMPFAKWQKESRKFKIKTNWKVFFKLLKRKFS